MPEHRCRPLCSVQQLPEPAHLRFGAAEFLEAPALAVAAAAAAAAAGAAAAAETAAAVAAAAAVVPPPNLDAMPALQESSKQIHNMLIDAWIKNNNSCM